MSKGRVYLAVEVNSQEELVNVWKTVGLKAPKDRMKIFPKIIAVDSLLVQCGKILNNYLARKYNPQIISYNAYMSGKDTEFEPRSGPALTTSGEKRSWMVDKPIRCCSQLELNAVINSLNWPPYRAENFPVFVDTQHRKFIYNSENSRLDYMDFSEISRKLSLISLSNPSEKALRYNSGKSKWGLVHFASLKPMVDVLEFGAKKYSADNWKKGFDKKELLESMFRHVVALMDGEENCPESGLPHMGHIQCNAMFYNFHFTPKDNG